MSVGTTLSLSGFEISRKKKRVWVAARLEREGSGFSLKEIRSKSVNFLKPSLSIYSIPLGLGLNYLALK